MTKIEELTNEQLDVLVAEEVKGWMRSITGPFWLELNGVCRYRTFPTLYNAYPVWSPSTNIAHAFQVDRPEWAWEFEEVPHWYDSDVMLKIELWTDQNTKQLAYLELPLDTDNKVAAYCRGRCITALKACGVEEE